MAATLSPALIVHNLSVGYPRDRHAVEHVTFDVYQGERVAVIGPNGAGKSTLFKAIAGLLPHTEGEISLHGKDCRTSHALIGYVPQTNEVDWRFPATVADVVFMGRVRRIGWFKFPSRHDREQVMYALEQVGMAHLAQRQIGNLSGGQKRRVFIARALAQETDVLLLDEPFSGVDVAAENEIMETLDALKARDISIILATHDMEKALTRFDKMLLLRRRLIAYGDPESVFTPDNLKAAYGGHVHVIAQGNETFVVTDEHGCC